MGLVLASTSPYRKQLLDRLGIPFTQLAPRCDEAALKGIPYPGPAGLARHLAREKAVSLLRECPGDTIIGGDQVAEIDGQILEKPGTVAKAIDQLTVLSGRTHVLATAIAVCVNGDVRTHVDLTRLTMRSLNRDSIARYVEADLPLDCAGSYKLESRGISLFERIETTDHTAIIGMPLIMLTSMLRSAGFAIP
ncbi:MAG: septum formation protein Maf [Planctomycetes bacterium]|nr:septum formation protein Maf [Planctomycetota bacterium]